MIQEHTHANNKHIKRLKTEKNKTAYIKKLA